MLAKIRNAVSPNTADPEPSDETPTPAGPAFPAAKKQDEEAYLDSFLNNLAAEKDEPEEDEKSSPAAKEVDSFRKEVQTYTDESGQKIRKTIKRINDGSGTILVTTIKELLNEDDSVKDTQITTDELKDPDYEEPKRAPAPAAPSAVASAVTGVTGFFKRLLPAAKPKEEEKDGPLVQHPNEKSNNLFDDTPDLNPFRSNSTEEAVPKSPIETTNTSRTFEEDGKKTKETVKTESNGAVKTITITREVTDQDGNVSTETNTTTEAVKELP